MQLLDSGLCQLVKILKFTKDIIKLQFVALYTMGLNPQHHEIMIMKLFSPQIHFVLYIIICLFGCEVYFSSLNCKSSVRDKRKCWNNLNCNMRVFLIFFIRDFSIRVILSNCVEQKKILIAHNFSCRSTSSWSQLY